MPRGPGERRTRSKWEGEVLEPHTLTLIAITDDLRDGIEGLVARAGAAVRGGATMVQLRLKDADGRQLVEVARRLVTELPVPVVVNDRVDVALAAGAAGAHVGTRDLPVDVARRITPAGFILGASVVTDEDVAGVAGADYAGIGPVFPTPSKADAGEAIGTPALAALVERCGIPAVGIGGIDPGNARAVLDAGCTGVAVIKAVFGAGDPEEAARRLRRAIGR